ncbi:hypothetical protein NDU88_009876 [Pleurodeles waltl]|uniref:Uncharacterized protein n=1 Tax=Pleurodeles waltl TaxID=8319 RepID=A0AAV7QX01_PLEWA|nr:hypothetical protein NDU88_009876 [Pleurodeles waltl]
MCLGVGARPLTGPPPARVPCAGLECLGRAETWCPRGTGERRSRRSPLVLGGRTMRCWTRGPGERPGESEPRERGSPA